MFARIFNTIAHIVEYEIETPWKSITVKADILDERMISEVVEYFKLIGFVITTVSTRTGNADYIVVYVSQ